MHRVVLKGGTEVSGVCVLWFDGLKLKPLSKSHPGALCAEQPPLSTGEQGLALLVFKIWLKHSWLCFLWNALG